MKPDDLGRERRSIEREAKRAVRSSGLVWPAGTRQLAALPVRTLEAALESWFVPLVAHERLVAYLRFTPDHVLKGISSFLRHPARLDNCPLAADWLDERRIAARADAMRARRARGRADALVRRRARPPRLGRTAAWASCAAALGLRSWYQRMAGPASLIRTPQTHQPRKVPTQAK